MLSSHARHGSCAGRRVDGAKLASGAIAASKRQVRARGGFSRFCVKSRRRPREPPMAGGDPVVRRDVLGAVAGAAQRPKHSVLATLGGYGRRLLGRRDTQKGDGDDRRDH